MLRWFAGLVFILLVVAGGAYWIAGRGAPPAIKIDRPDRVIGQAGTVDVVIEAPRGRLTSFAIALEQNGRSIPLFSLDAQQSATLTQIDADHVRVSRPVGKQSVPELQQGPARITVSAARPSFLNLRTLSSATSKDFQVRLDPPRLAVLSTKHYVNHGGSEMVVYRATPAEITSGVRVGDLEYPGFPASGAGMAGADPAVNVAFFALLHDQPINAPIAS